ELAISQIEKDFGKGAIMRLGNAPASKIDSIPTGALSLDLALGGSGIPRGRIIEIFGPESSGKSTLALNIVAQCQKIGGTAAYVDAENALDAEYARKIGVNTDDLLVSQPDTGEQGLEIVETLVRSGAVDIIVVDSVAALVPKAEIEGDMGDQHMGLQARLMSQALRKLTAIISKSKVVVVFINQLREKIGVMFGNPETTPGGRALKFYSSVRIDIRRVETIKEGELMVGNRVRAKMVKNKVAPPFREAIFDIVFGQGINRAGATIEAAVEQNVVEKSGTWYSYSGGKLGQGKEAAVKYLQDHEEILTEIEAKTKEKYFSRDASKELEKKAESKARLDAEAVKSAAAKAEAAAKAAASKKDEDKPAPAAKKTNVTEFKDLKAKVINDKAANG
ncbi:MAG: recombinase RecA, partial [Oligoflexia bacterium]|nr:recombinase RecA [Oligoflexia bacterium]